MKALLIALGIMAIVATAAAMSAEDEAYLEGLNDGYAMGYMAVKGQTIPDMEAQYNKGADIINAWLDTVGYTGGEWGYLQKSNHTLPNIFADPDGIWRQV